MNLIEALSVLVGGQYVTNSQWHAPECYLFMTPTGRLMCRHTDGSEHLYVWSHPGDIVSSSWRVVASDVAKPEVPPNRLEVIPGPSGLCFWLGHLLRWETKGRNYAQEVCIRCGHTGRTQSRPQGPSAPPAWQNPNDGVKG